MGSIQERSALERLIAAILECSVGSLREPKRIADFVKSWLRFPLQYSAGRVIDATPVVTFAELFPDHAAPDRLISPGRLERHDWNVRLDEKLYIGLMIQSIAAGRIFEIG